MQGFLLKKKEKLGKWKQLYFVLKQDGADSHLYFYESPKRTKPKGLIDLNCAFLYAVHESFFDKRHCFQLVEKALPCLATVTYLAAEDAGELEDWFSGEFFFMLLLGLIGLMIHIYSIKGSSPQVCI